MTAHLALVALLLGAGVGSVAIGLQIGFDEGLLCFGGSLALLAAALPVLVRAHTELYQPVWLVLLVVSVGVTSKAFYVCLGSRHGVEFLLRDLAPRDLLPAVLVITIAFACLSSGYVVGDVRFALGRVGRLLAPRRWSSSRLAFVMGVLAAIATVSLTLFVLRMHPSFETIADLSRKRFLHLEGAPIARGALGYLRWGMLCATVAFYLGYAHLVRSRGRLWSRLGVAVVALAVFATLIPVFLSQRKDIAFLIIRCVVIWMCLRGVPKLRQILVPAVAGTVLMVAILGVRTHAVRTTGSLPAAAAASFVQTTLGGRNSLDLTKTAHLLAAVPGTIPFQYGRTLVTWLALPIPRTMWPGKPAIGVGIELGPTVFGTPRESGVPPGLVGELYLNFGVTGVLVGFLLTGFVLRSVSSSLAGFFPSPAAAVVYAVLVVQLSVGLLSTHVSGTIAQLLMEGIPLAAALYVLQKDAPREPGTAPR